MELNEVKAKIKKLLTLSEDGANDHESYVALMKAQELMAKYKLNKSDISDEEKKQCIHRKTTAHYSTRSSDYYLNELAIIIAENFCCVNYVSTPHKSRTHYVCFMGMEEDVDIAEEVFHAANAAIIRGYNRVYKDLCREYDITYVPAEYFNPAKTGYIEGYLAGLKIALDSQKEQHQEWGLVLVAPQEAQNFINGLESRNFRHTILVDNTYYEEGYNDGINFHLNKKLDNSKFDKIEEGI